MDALIHLYTNAFARLACILRHFPRVKRNAGPGSRTAFDIAVLA